MGNVVAIVGRPNVGKSTLFNRLTQSRQAIVNEEAGTTRDRQYGKVEWTGREFSIIDTGGWVVNSEDVFEGEINKQVQIAIEEADVILWIVDVSEHIGAAERELAERLRKCRQPLILAVNKIDKITDKARLAAQVKAYEDFCRPKDLVAVAALKSENVELLLDTLYRYLPEGPFFYSEDTVTEEPMRELAGELIREQTLRLLRDEVPHGVAVTVERMKEREDGGFDIDANIICERESHKGMVIGKGGQMLKRIGIGARKAIEEMTESKVNLKLWVKVRRDWRDNDTQLRSFGYDIKKV